MFWSEFRSGQNPSPKTIMSSNSCKGPQKKYKIDHIPKLRIAQKKVIHAKNMRQINSNLPYKFSHFVKKVEFFWGAIWVPVAPIQNMMWYETLRPSFYLAHRASFISTCPLLREGVCRSAVEKQPILLNIFWANLSQRPSPQKWLNWVFDPKRCAMFWNLWRTIFRFFRFLFLDEWSILYTKYLINWLK